MAEQPDHEAHGELGHDPEDVGVNADVQQRHHQEQLRDGQLNQGQQHDGDNRRHHHEQRVENVVGGNHPRTFLLRRTRLDQRIQRHDIKAAENAEADNRQQHPPGFGHAQQRQPVMRRRRGRNIPRVPPPEQTEQGQAERAERHQADLHLVTAKALTQQRAQGDAHRKQGQHQCDYGLVAVQPILGIGRNLREINGADEPEPGVADNRTRHGRRLAQPQAQGRPRLSEDVPLQLHLRRRRTRPRNPLAGQVTQRSHQNHRTGHHRRIVGAGHHHPGADGAGQNGQEGAHLDQAVTADQFLLMQGLGQD
ncbi:hypothetical protein D3C79_742340 [compost metagenome]